MDIWLTGFLCPEAGRALLKRVGLLVTEVVLFSLGIVASLILASLLDSSENGFAGIGFFSGLLLTTVGWVALRYKTRRWKIKQDAARWMAGRSFGKKYPRRAKLLRITHRCLLWVPSASAALALFFMPVASHVLLLGRRLVPHYILSTPLTWMVIRGSDGRYPFVQTFFSGEGAARYGMTPMWFNHSMPSGAEFIISDPRSGDGWSRPEIELEGGQPTHVAKREFKMGAITMNCWEYRDHYDNLAEMPPSMFRPPVLWQVLCSTEPNGVDFNLRAAFTGHKDDVPAFYRVLVAAKPIR